VYLEYTMAKDLNYKAREFASYHEEKELGGEVSKRIILAFTHYKRVDYSLLQTLVLGEVGAAAREAYSFDHRLRRLRELGYIIDCLEKSRDEQGIIIANRYYELTKLGKGALKQVQKDRNRLERMRKQGIPLEERATGRGRTHMIKGDR